MSLTPIAKFQAHTQQLVDLLVELVEIESPSRQKEAVDAAGGRVAAELRRLGAQVEVVEQADTGNHVIGRWNGAGSLPGPQRNGILFLCHLDTVHPIGTLARNPIRIEDGKLYGPGTEDMKSGITVVLGAVDVLQAEGAWVERPVTALFTGDEETGSLSSRTLIEQLGREAELVLCCEPALPDGSLKTWRKGVGRFEITTHGKAAHAGAYHELGRNAIEELAHQILKMQSWTDYRLGTTLNTGRIQGGTASNVVPAEASAVIDFRVRTPEEGERIIALMRSLHPILEGTSLEVVGGMNRPPMPRDALMEQTFERVQGVGRELGLELLASGSGGGSDANFVAPYGVPVIDGMGAVGDGEHTEHEFIRVESLPERAALLAGIITRW